MGDDAQTLAKLQQEIVSLRQQLGVHATQPAVETDSSGESTSGGEGAHSSGLLLSRRMEWERKRATPAAGQANELTMLQFNVLADGLCGLSPTLGDFSRPPKEVLDWGYRGPLLVAEMLRHNADVITAQVMTTLELVFSITA